MTTKLDKWAEEYVSNADGCDLKNIPTPNLVCLQLRARKIVEDAYRAGFKKCREEALKTYDDLLASAPFHRWHIEQLGEK